MLSLLGRVMLEEQEFSSSEVLKIFVESGTGSAKMCRELIYIRITKGTLKRQSEILQNHYAQKTSWGYGDLNAGHRTPRSHHFHGQVILVLDYSLHLPNASVLFSYAL